MWVGAITVILQWQIRPGTGPREEFWAEVKGRAPPLPLGRERRTGLGSHTRATTGAHIGYPIWSTSANPFPLPPPHIRDIFLRKKMKSI